MQSWVIGEPSGNSEGIFGTKRYTMANGKNNTSVIVLFLLFIALSILLVAQTPMR